MKNLLPILALLLLAGCTSEPTTPTELERCIEVNEVKNNFVEKYDDFLVQRNSSKDIGSEEFSVFMETLNRVEEEINYISSSIIRSDFLSRNLYCNLVILKESLRQESTIFKSKDLQL